MASVYAITGRSVKFRCMFQIQFGHGGQFRSRSGLITLYQN